MHHHSTRPYPADSDTFISANRLLLAGAPVEVELVLDLDGGIVVGDLTRCLAGAVAGAEDDAVVDVEDSSATAGRPDVAGSGHLVLLGVNVTVGPDAAADDRGRCCRGGRSVLAEEVGAGELAGDALVELCPAVVDAAEDGELVATGVLEVQVQLAVLVAVGAGVSRADVGLEAIKAKGDDLKRESVGFFLGSAKWFNLQSYPGRRWWSRCLEGSQLRRSSQW